MQNIHFKISSKEKPSGVKLHHRMIPHNIQAQYDMNFYFVQNWMIPFHQRKFEGTSVLRIFMMAKNEWDGMDWIGMEWKRNGMEWIRMEWHGMMARKLPVSDFEECLARRLRSHSCQIQMLRDVSHESFIFTCAVFRFWGTSRTKASFSHLPLSDFEGHLARKLHFHIFHFQILRDVSHESFIFTCAIFRSWRTSRTISFVFTFATFRFWGTSRTKASFSHVPFSDFEGCLARKPRFHICHFQILRDVSHESFIFTSATFRFWGMSRTKASFSHVPFSDFEGSLARKLHFHICHFQILRDVSHESFIFTCAIFRSWRTSRTISFVFTFATFRFWGMSRTKASFSHVPFSDFEGRLARKPRFHICHFQILRDVSHESFVFTSATFRFWGMSRTKASFSHVPFSDFEGSLARKLHFHICHFQTLRDVWHEMRF